MDFFGIKNRYRWVMVALLALATTINYIDRNVIAFTMIDEGFRKEMLGIDPSKPLSAADMDRFKVQMGYVDWAFKWAYGLGFIVVGWLIDRIGTRRGFAWSIFAWSLAGISVAFTRTFGGLSMARFALGLGEAGNYPSGLKSIAEWFPQKERALATGIFNSGANIGIIVTALLVPWLTLQFGWRAAFVVTGSLGLLLLLLWWLFYYNPDAHPQVSAEELSYIKAEQIETEENPIKISWWHLLGYRQTWAFVTGKVISDPIWFFFLSWLPDFFNTNGQFSQKLDLKTIGIPFLVIYLVSDLGNIFFGWLSSRFIQKGWSPNRARKTTMLICGICVLPVLLAPLTSDYRIAVALLGLATAAHQGFSVNNFTMTTDLFPKTVVASVVGIGGFMGAMVSGLVAASTGWLITKIGYAPLFLYIGIGYLLALGIIQLLVPKMKRVEIA
jgi:MFS transporter, ACS family, hexuronate transporter